VSKISIVKISWHGHACISIENLGKILVIDPHDGYSLGIKRPEIKADYILITHDHFDHNASNVVAKKDSKIFKMKEGVFEADPFKILGVKTFHDKERGRRRGLNIAYKITTSGGLDIFHGGDLGHIPDEEMLRKIGEVDIVILPVGGTFTIDHSEALEIFSMMKGKIFIPIHYWIKGINLPLAPIDSFVKEAERRGLEIIRSESNTLEIEDNKNVVSGLKRALILRYI
jgi:L-ascorbate metabolism protein UlaG (beta-lactamase superfamily)